MQSTIAKLIITRFAREFTRRKLIPFVGVVVLFFILILTMFVLGRYACWFDRVLGFQPVNLLITELLRGFILIRIVTRRHRGNKPVRWCLR